MQLCFGGKADLPFPLLFLAKVGHSSLRLALTQPLVPSTWPSNPQFFPFRASYLTSSDWHAILPRVCCHQASKCQSKSLSIRAPRSCRLAFTPFPSPRRTARCKSLFSSFLFMRLRTLSFSVSRNSFICHSYENNRGVYQQFPFWNSLPSASCSNLERPTSNLSLFTLFRALSFLFSLFAQRVFHNSFAIKRIRTLFKNSRVWVRVED